MYDVPTASCGDFTAFCVSEHSRKSNLVSLAIPLSSGAVNCPAALVMRTMSLWVLRLVREHRRALSFSCDSFSKSSSASLVVMARAGAGSVVFLLINTEIVTYPSGGGKERGCHVSGLWWPRPIGSPFVPLV